MLDTFREVWLCDFEFQADPGERPKVHCLVAHELLSGKRLRLWVDELGRNPPFSTGSDVLFVAYFASAELGCYLSLGWEMPQRLLDLFVEFRCLTNGLPLPSGNGLIGALVHFGLDSIAAATKTEMRDLAIRGGPFSDIEKLALLDYCETDVVALAQLIRVMADKIDWPRAVLRGRYMAAVAKMEHTGTPIDTDILGRLRSNWGKIKSELISRVDSKFGVFEGQTFKRDLFAKWLAENKIPWPRLPSGQLALDSDTFRSMSKMYPQVAPLHELRHTLGELRLESLSVGADGRNRTLLSPFSSRTGRNQPSNSKFIFGPSCWMRGLIKPTWGRAVAYVDWSQQEFAIAAKLSGDLAMMEAYSSGDPYLAFAKQAGAVPSDASKQSHPHQREQFKVCSLAVQYGMGEDSLAAKLGKPSVYGRELLRAHKETYPDFWSWSQSAVDQAMLNNRVWTVFGWELHIGAGETNPRSLANFPVQANGAEMLRLACCLATEIGIRVCAPVHDALLVEGAADEIRDVVVATQDAMREAGRIVLSGFELRTDAEIVAWPNRYMDPRGRALWDELTGILEDETLAVPRRVPPARLPGCPLRTDHPVQSY
ncbi:DNA polymerase [Bythopirellula goksoeyrii]|uniref:DNA polymerase I, thermostable n=1 Tax=Bythopirellula goksoeyrii TaxID=1400387 RepID=A0A5B9QB78_9BACT|nr:DNA polymerase [Bythopirellula goksoeyrii]QEG36314.1 DNA polymerase I, thermostable [Bythopirellula goksoeyrii]